jgi:hypothetical protein
MTNNTLLNEVIETRNGHYCHAFEAEEVYQLKSLAEAVFEENEEKHGFKACLEFLESLEIICTEEENEEEIYSFDFFEYIKSLNISSFIIE